MNIICKSTATKWTKERVKRHGPDFEIVDGPKMCEAHKEQAILVRSTKTNWLGWFPIKEINHVD
jgi:hypothetical protein